ncbi:MAG: radical SAM family heme chaperone HemW [Oscillospiraceae bacterium]
MAGLYIHIPFCRRKCPYCDFYSVNFSEETAEKYVAAVIHNIENYGNKFGKVPIESIYFGGGTPSILSGKALGRIISAADRNFSLENPEISLEANPCTVDLKKLAELRSNGFNRISIGVQSLVDSELKTLGRLHNSKTAIDVILDAKRAGFENISADLMIGTVGQTFSSLATSIERLVALPISHISAYMLKIEEGTAYDCEEIISKAPNDDLSADFYLKTCELLENSGFFQYEISNFAKKGFECKHNLKYWQCKEYIGIGAAAHSYFNGKRYGVPRSVSDFIENFPQAEIITEENPADFTEFAMLKIRLAEGVNLDECNKIYGINQSLILQKCNLMEKNGLVKIDKNTIKLTRNGCLLSNQIIAKLFL